MAQPLAPNLELQQPDVLGQHAQLVRGTPVLAVPPESRAPYYIGLFAFLGAVTFGTVNAMRRRPLSYGTYVYIHRRRPGIHNCSGITGDSRAATKLLYVTICVMCRSSTRLTAISIIITRAFAAQNRGGSS